MTYQWLRIEFVPDIDEFGPVEATNWTCAQSSAISSRQSNEPQRHSPHSMNTSARVTTDTAASFTYAPERRVEQFARLPARALLLITTLFWLYVTLSNVLYARSLHRRRPGE
jgi:hypothetical protein